MYNTRIMQYYHNKDHYGVIEHPDFAATRKNSACGDELSFSGCFVDGRITDIKFSGTGCMISLACAALLAEKVHGMTTEQARAFSVPEHLALLGFSLGPQRTACALLALETLHEALQNVAHD